jgi:hypothetical protein
MNSKLKVSVNKNPTKEGIKVQFVLPQTLEGDAKAAAAQKLQSKLNQGLQQYNLTVSQDTDVPYSNVIGFLIPIADIKLLIKNAIGGGKSAPEEAPAEEAPAPEKPVKEIKRMMELAGLKEGMYTGESDMIITLDYDNEITKIEDKHYHYGPDGAIEDETDTIESNFDYDYTMETVHDLIKNQKWNKIILKVIHDGEEMEEEFNMNNWKGISYYIK